MAQGPAHSLLWHGLPWLLALLAWSPDYLQPAAAKLAQWRAAQGIAPAVGLQFGLEAWRGQDFAWNADLSGAAVLSLCVLGLAALALREPLTHARLPAPEAAAEPEAAPPEPPKYGERALPSDTRSDYLARLQRCMDEEQPWRDGELLLDDLAARLALTPKELSQLVNDAHGAQFQDFLNRHRVAELQRLLRDPARAGQSILALGLEADFNSKSALNRVFKRHARFTPSE